MMESGNTVQNSGEIIIYFMLQFTTIQTISLLYFPLFIDPKILQITEIYFLILHLLASTPCKNSFELLEKELIEHNLLPRKFCWTGESRPATYEELVTNISVYFINIIQYK